MLASIFHLVALCPGETTGLKWAVIPAVSLLSAVFLLSTGAGPSEGWLWVRGQHRRGQRRLSGEILLRLLLAPMEGLLDELLRAQLTALASYDYAVSPFARISENVPARRFFTRIAPELLAGGCTAAGTPVRLQLLGSDPGRMAASAARLARLQPPGVDLNFGCPAPTVNRHRGGAALLDEPALLHEIASAVRAALPASIPLSAKMRLGIRDTSQALACAQALASAGIDSLVVHARTKLDGYRPPAHWEWIARIAQAVAVPVVANGEVWTAADWLRCRASAGVDDVMLGRGAVADPFLAARIRAGQFEPPTAAQQAQEWAAVQVALGEFWQAVKASREARHAPGRIKQWLKLLARTYPAAAALFASLRPLTTVTMIDELLRRQGVPLPCGGEQGLGLGLGLDREVAAAASGSAATVLLEIEG